MAYPRNIVECILKVYPDAVVDEDFVCSDSAKFGLDITKWNIRGNQTDTKPTEAELNAVADEVNAEIAASAYQNEREWEYPSKGEQLDMIYHDMKNGTTTHAAAVEAIKARWPKDNSGPIE